MLAENIIDVSCRMVKTFASQSHGLLGALAQSILSTFQTQGFLEFAAQEPAVGLHLARIEQSSQSVLWDATRQSKPATPPPPLPAEWRGNAF